MATPQVIEDLVEKFKQDPQRYKSSMFNEAHTRREFIDRLFEALGWDMNNEKDNDVLYESSLKVGVTTKAPDYVFVIDDDMKFLVEAKKPCVNLADNPDPAFQLRSYAWNAKLPVSILTDFEEFAVYDCRYPPKKTDNPDTALIRRLNYTDYLTCWDWISKRFSKAAIQGGYLDEYLNKVKGRRGTKEVDAVFLDAITSWREALRFAIL